MANHFNFVYSVIMSIRSGPAKMNHTLNSNTAPAASNVTPGTPVSPVSSSTTGGVSSSRRQFLQRIQELITPTPTTSPNPTVISTSGPSLVTIPPLSPGFASRLELVPIEKKSLDRAYREMDKVVRVCQQPRLQLKNSPPYILDILPDMHQHLQKILSKHESSLSTTLAQSEYFQVFLSNLLHKCKQTVKLFKESKNRIFEENSESRRKLIRQSLVYSHILTDFKALFPAPNYLFIGVFHLCSTPPERVLPCSTC